MSQTEEFKEALGADIVTPLNLGVGCLSISEALALRSWFDERQKKIRQENNGGLAER